MRRIFPALIVFAILFSGFSSTVEANDKWVGGSVYSHFGPGLPYDFRASYADGMGVRGVAMHDNRMPTNANPAAWSRSVFTNISGTFEVQSFDKSIDGVRSQSTRFLSGPFQMVLPVSRDRIGVSVSVTPLTASRYSTRNEYDLERHQNHSGEELGYVLENRGTGGINRIEAGVGVRLTNNLSVGYAPSLLLGVIEKNQDIFFDNDDYRPTNLKESTTHLGFGNRMGIYYSRRDLFQQNDRLGFGADISLPVNFVSERELTSRIDRSDVTIRSASDYGDGKARFPLEASAGISYNLNPYFIISSDVLYQNWNDYLNFEGNSEQFLKDRIRLGLGTQYIAARRDGAGFLSRFIYRMGVSYDTGSLEFKNTNIDTFTLHAGLGIPSSRTNSSININAEYGFRGTDSSELISENIFAISVSFSLSEIMFIQRRLQ